MVFTRSGNRVELTPTRNRVTRSHMGSFEPMCESINGSADELTANSSSSSSQCDDFCTPKKQGTESLEEISFSPDLKTIDYEQKRLDRMRENLKALSNLGVADVVKENRQVHVVQQKEKKRKVRSNRSRIIAAAASTRSSPRKKSERLQKKQRIRYSVNGESIRVFQQDGDGNEDLPYNASEIAARLRAENMEDPSSLPLKSNVNLSDEDRKEMEFIRGLEDRFYSCEEYFLLKGVEPLLVQESGAFSGWVNENLRKQIGIAEDSSSAWETNGGGVFSFKTLNGESAKEQARKNLFKNPNSYFYRHCAPGIDHWQGDWTEAEDELFLKTAKEFGVGTKWGLFSTYIPHRVGYQCSNYYRAHFIEGGLIWDDNFMLDKYGKSIYVGRKGSKRY